MKDPYDNPGDIAFARWFASRPDERSPGDNHEVGFLGKPQRAGDRRKACRSIVLANEG
jgi:hypothetical protein